MVVKCGPCSAGPDDTLYVELLPKRLFLMPTTEEAVCGRS